MQETYDKLWEFFLQDSADRADAEKTVRHIDFTAIFWEAVEEDSKKEPALVLKVRRPGLLIGAKAKRVEALQKFFDAPIRILEEESCILADRIVPCKYYDDPDMWGDYDAI